MRFTEDKVGNLFLLSTLISFIDITIVVAVRMAKISFSLTAILFVMNLFIFWNVRKSEQTRKALNNWIQNTTFVQVVFLLLTSLLSIGLGFISWIFLFESGSMVRNVLLLLGPVLGWSVVMIVFLLFALGTFLSEHDAKKDGLLVGTVLFSVVGYLFLFWMSAKIFPYTMDDAFITFRYSKNLVEGFGPTFNPGLPPVEGYTTFFWMLLMTIPHIIGIDVAIFSKIFGVLLMCGTFIIISLLTLLSAKQFPVKLRLFVGSLAVYLLAMLPITSTHAVSGMETSLFIFLTCLLVFMVALGVSTESHLLFWAPLVGLGIGLTRPEGNAISLLLLAYGWFLSKPPVRKRLISFGIGLYALPGALYFLWRYFYYDLILPLPFYLKVIHGGVLLGGLKDVGTYLQYLLPSTILFLIIALFSLKKEHIVFLIPMVFLLIFYLFPIHVMGFNWRFIYPATPFIMLFIALGGGTLLNLFREHAQTPNYVTSTLLLGFFLMTFLNFQGLPEFIKGTRAYGVDIIFKYKVFGDVLRKYNNKYQMTIALLDAGTVPYYSDWLVIDLYGLNDKDIAFRTIPLEEIIFKNKSVDLILFNVGTNPKRISQEYAQSQLLYEAARQQGMERIGILSLQRAYNIWVVGYPETELAEYIQNNMQFMEAP